MNPEIQFRTMFKPDYTGMALTELEFGTLLDHRGKPQVYKLDLITPPTLPEKPMPVVFFIHGGAFQQPCDKRQAYICLFARSLTEAGYAVVSPDYPLFDDAEDMKANGGDAAGCAKASEAVHVAYGYLLENAVRLHLNMDKVAIMGGSAGGMAGFFAIADWQDHYSAFVNLWGAPKEAPDLAKFPPTLSVHGTADKAVLYEWELPIQQRFEELHIPHELITLEGSGHTPLDHMEEFLPQTMKLLAEHLH